MRPQGERAFELVKSFGRDEIGADELRDELRTMTLVGGMKARMDQFLDSTSPKPVVQVDDGKVILYLEGRGYTCTGYGELALNLAMFKKIAKNQTVEIETASGTVTQLLAAFKIGRMLSKLRVKYHVVSPNVEPIEGGI